MKSGTFNPLSGLCHACMKMLLVFSAALLFPLFAYTQSKEDSLQKVLGQTRVDSLKVDVMVQLSATLMSSDINMAQQYASDAIRLAASAHYLKGLADAYRYLGNSQYNQSQYKEAVDSWLKSLAFYDSVGDKSKMANIYANLGAVYESQSSDVKALEYNLKSLKLAEQIRDTARMAYALTNIGVIYGKDSLTYDKALQKDQEAFNYAAKLNNNYLAGTLAVNMGEIYYYQNKDDDALRQYEIAVAAWEGTESLPYALLKIGEVYSRRGEFNTALSYQTKALDIAQSLNLKRDMASALNSLANTEFKKGNISGALIEFKQAENISLEINVKEELREAYEGLALTYSALKDFNNAYNYQKKLTDIKAELYSIEHGQQLNGQLFDFEMDKKQSQISLLNKDKEIAEQLAKRQRFAKNASLVGLGLVIIILFIIFRNYRIKVRTNKILDQQKAEIETLLLNILPQEVAAELQRDGHATPMYYESVSVLFTDFKGFSSIAEGMSPRDLVTELNEYFSEFDDIIEKYQLEKIKTIGDAYMCAGGIPTANHVHPVSIVRAALDIQHYILQKNERRRQLGIDPWDLRIGIHTGPVVAGVVGRKKYAYDIWGNAVNIASRMESNGQPGKVNISAATYNLVKDQFSCTYRGKIEAKNIGIIDMYFVERELGSGPPTLNGQPHLHAVDA
jgi:class 3 adenylate cyclase